MTNWNEYLLSLGARSNPDEPAHINDFGRALSAADLADGFVAVVTGLDLIAVTGADAAAFLHSQLTNDVEHLGEAEARLAGYCSPKGRLQATFLMWRKADAIFLQLPRDVRPGLQKRLAMFVLRAKAVLSDASAEPSTQVVLAVGGAKANAALQTLFATLPAAPYAKVDSELGTLVRVADAFDRPRYEWLTSQETALRVLPALTATLALGGTDAWNLSGIHAGVPQITTRTQEQFVPQMVNFELLGGVNFKKGCYPGQEIVARSQYLGKLKRRTALATIDGASAAPGDEVIDMADPGQPCGMIVNAAPNGADGVDVLVEMKLAALETAEVRLGSAAGAPLRLQPMPYSLGALEL